jgi:tetratricopeptide (TPR) repeat protein
VVVDALRRPEEAEALFRENYEFALRADGAHAPDTAHAAVNLGKALMDSGRYDEALPLFGQGLATLRRELGDDNPATISAIANLAAVYYYLERREESNALLREAVDRSARVLGPVHLHTLRRRGNIIRAAIWRGDFEAGIAEATELMTICERELGPAHSQTLGAVEILVTAVAMGRTMEEAERIALDWHERLASEHGSTSRSAGRMAYLVMNLYDSWGKEGLEAEWRGRAEASVYVAPELIRTDESTP